MDWIQTTHLIAQTLRKTADTFSGGMPDDTYIVIMKTADDVEAATYGDSICPMCDEAFCDEDCPLYELRHNHRQPGDKVMPDPLDKELDKLQRVMLLQTVSAAVAFTAGVCTDDSEVCGVLAAELSTNLASIATQTDRQTAKNNLLKVFDRLSTFLKTYGAK